jgi:hypothetical protein
MGLMNRSEIVLALDLSIANVKSNKEFQKAGCIQLPKLRRGHWKISGVRDGVHDCLNDWVF